MIKDLWLVLTGKLSSLQVELLDKHYRAMLGQYATRLAEADTFNRNMAIRLDPMLLGIGRVIAKIDPAFTKDPFDSKTRAESDEIGRKVIERLLAEHKTSTMYP